MDSLKGLIESVVVGAIVGAIIIASSGIFEAALHSAISLGFTSVAELILLLVLVPFLILLYRPLDDL